MDQRLWKRYWRRAVWVAFFLRLTPYVRMVSLNGSMTSGRLNPESDIDFYIALRPGRLYFGRFLVTGLLQLAGLRPRGELEAGRVCLNHFTVSTNLVIEGDPAHMARLFHNLIPLFSTGGCYQRFCEANRWMSQYGHPVIAYQPVMTDTWLTLFIRDIGELLLTPLVVISQGNLRSMLVRKFEEDERARHPQSQVIISDRELRFHLHKD